MNEYEFKDKLIQIDKSKKCLRFLVNRVLSNDYRGIQISQHNRYSKEEIFIILQEIYNIAGSDLLQIRTTDLSKRANNIPEEERYAELVSNINKKIGRCTQDSLRKNIFVDMHRMGLIKRYNEQKKELGPFDSGIKKFVSISNLGIEIIQNCNDIFKQNILYTRALENIMNGFAENIFNIVLTLGSNYISQNELLFGTFLHKKINGHYYSHDDIIDFIKEFRSLSKYQKKEVIKIIKCYCNPDNFNKSKLEKRDWHNWLNETQQIFTLFSQTIYFDWNKNKNRIYIRIGKNGLYEDNNKLKRSISEKQKYFEEHKISKTVGFELHHIVPLCWAKSISDFQILDNWKNLVYIDAYSHSKITQNNNSNVKLSFDFNNNAIFTDFFNKKVICEKDKNILYDKNKKILCLNIMKKFFL